MSTIKDIYDLIEKFEKSVNDRKTLDLLFPIKEKIIVLQREILDIEKKNFDTEKQHFEEMNKLQSKYSKLEEEHKKPKSDKISSIGLTR